MVAPKPIIIICGGFYRTGSTWLFNLIKQTIIEAGFTVSQTGDTAPFLCVTDYCIYKVHGFSPDLLQSASFVFYSERDMGEIAVSWRTMMGVELTDTQLSVYKESLAYRAKSVLTLDFQRIYNDQHEVAIEVASALNLDVNTINVLQRLAAIKPPTESNYDAETYLFHNHISPK